jgi:7-keto-8-aminopelargonate synthetase-like enzyme
METGRRLKEIVDLARRYEAMVMVDEAHAFGVLGQRGSGLVEELGLEGQVDIQMGTLSKAAGCFGAYACGTKILREYLINKSRSFIYTTAMPPALAQAARAALQIIHSENQLRRKLQENADYLRAKLQAMGFDTMNSSTPIIPILVKDPLQASAMSKRLLAGYFCASHTSSDGANGHIEAQAHSDGHTYSRRFRSIVKRVKEL